MAVGKENLHKNNIVNQYVTTIVGIFDSVKQIYETNLETIKQVEGSELDLKHEVQLTNKKNARDGYKIYSTWYEMLVRRRIAKDENEIIEELYSFLDQNKEFKNRLSQIQGNSRKRFESQLHRSYQPRQLDNLTCTESCSMVHKPFEDKLIEFNNSKKKNNNKKNSNDYISKSKIVK